MWGFRLDPARFGLRLRHFVWGFQVCSGRLIPSWSYPQNPQLRNHTSDGLNHEALAPVRQESPDSIHPPTGTPRILVHQKTPEPRVPQPMRSGLAGYYFCVYNKTDFYTFTYLIIVICMCVYIYIYMHIYIYRYIDRERVLYMYVYIYIHTYTHIYYTCYHIPLNLGLGLDWGSLGPLLHEVASILDEEVDGALRLV